MAENKTKLTESDVKAFIDTVEDEVKREDSQALVELMGEVTGKPPKMWGPSIVGFGKYH